jgi:hypothetical protein
MSQKNRRVGELDTLSAQKVKIKLFFHIPFLPFLMANSSDLWGN